MASVLLSIWCFITLIWRFRRELQQMVAPFIYPSHLLNGISSISVYQGIIYLSSRALFCKLWKWVWNFLQFFKDRKLVSIVFSFVVFSLLYLSLLLSCFHFLLLLTTIVAYPDIGMLISGRISLQNCWIIALATKIRACYGNWESPSRITCVQTPSS